MQTYISAQKEVNIPWTTEFNSLLPWRPLPKGLLLLDVFAFAYHSTNDQLPLSLLERCMINQNVSTYNQGRTTTELNSHGPALLQDLIGWHTMVLLAFQESDAIPPLTQCNVTKELDKKVLLSETELQRALQCFRTLVLVTRSARYQNVSEELNKRATELNSPTPWLNLLHWLRQRNGFVGCSIWLQRQQSRSIINFLGSF